jgi:hypothetical protein
VRRVPVPTVSRASGGAGAYRVTTGALRDRASADSLLRALRLRGVVGPAGGYVLRAPFSIKISSGGLTPADAHTLADGLRAKGWPVFGLVQRNRTLNLYVGAYETAEQAANARAALRADTLTTAVAYRIGSMF